MKKIKNKRLSSKNNRIIRIIIFVFVLLLFRNIYIKVFKNSTIKLTRPKVYEKIINTNALIVRDEHIYSYGEDINLEGINDTRVGVNKNLGTINNYSNKYGLNIGYVNKAIKELENNKYSDKNISTNDIIENINSYNYKDINNISMDFKIKNNKEYNEYLLEDYNIIKDTMESNGKKLKSGSSGYISTKVDGYEDIYNIYNIDLEFMDIDIDKSNTEINTEKNGFKIVNNNYYGMIFSFDKKELTNNYEVGGIIKIKVDDIYIDGTIKNLNINKNKINIFAEFNTYFEKFSTNRFYNINIVNYKANSFEIPEKSLVDNKGIKGVFIKKPSGVVDFKPVEVISLKNGKATISSGDEGIINFMDKELKTVNSYDEIIKNPKKFKLGQLIE